MATAYKDENNVPTIICALNTDGLTPTRVLADPTTHGLVVLDGASGSDNGRANAYRDENNVPVWLAVDSSDGVTPIELYANSSGALLIKST